MNESISGNAARAPLNGEQQAWLDAAWAMLEKERLAQLITELVNIPSPTGQEGEAAQYSVRRMREAGLIAQYEEMTARRGNAIGRLEGGGGGAGGGWEAVARGGFRHHGGLSR